MVMRSLKEIDYSLSKSEMSKLIDKLEYYSASEIHNIIAEASMLPLREL